MNELPIKESCKCGQGVCGEYQIGAVRKRMGINMKENPPQIFTTYELIRNCEIYKQKLKEALDGKRRISD